MAIARRFLDWSRPALPAVVDYLCREYEVLGLVDLSHVTVVVPGGRAERRLLELLTEVAGEGLHTPAVVTPEDLPESLYEQKRSFAPELVQKLAWAEVLRSTSRDRLADVVPRPPDDDQFEQWLFLGELIWSQHRELARDGLDFGDVAEQGVDVEGFDEHDRWRCLREMQQAYLDMLESLDLWDRQTARLYAVEHALCRTERDIVLVATVDLSGTLRKMLDQVPDDRVTALIHAPESIAARFDAYGCLEPGTWLDEPVPIDESRVRVVDGAGEQADAVARILADFDGDYRADEITIGVPDAAVVPQIRRQLGEFDVPTRWVVGTTVAETAPYRMLAAVADRLDAKRFDTFAALVRHPSVHDWLSQQGVNRDWLATLDAYYTRRLQAELGEWDDDDHEDAAVVRSVDETVRALLAPLEPAEHRDRPLAEWTEPILELLLNVHANVEFDKDTQDDAVVLRAMEEIGKALAEHADVPASLMPATSAATAIRTVLDRIEEKPIPPLPDAEAVEILGWLELPLDDAEATIVTTFNEGFVPSSVNSHLFLPNALRTRLGILDNDRRYARDAYATSAILASRERVDLVVARRDVHQNPLAPSRLLFATEPREIAERVRDFLSPLPAPPPLTGSLAPGVEHSELYVPKPEPLEEPVRTMSVTAFRTYLACPYRFYLQHVLRLGEVDDTAEELDGGAFGSLMHDVLAAFGRSTARDAVHAEEIRDFLRGTLADEVERRFGDARRPAVRIQVEQMNVRLDAFAEWRARWAAEGWRITFVEEPDLLRTVPFGPSGANPPAGEPSIRLRGRIDRIDRLGDEDRWTIFDYKTGESAKAPDRVHRRKTTGAWEDLQLPLYRHLAAPLGVTGDVRLGYITITKTIDEIRERIADWSDADLANADETAAEVVRGVLAEEFWPPRQVPSTYFTEFAGICQVGVLDAGVPG